MAIPAGVARVSITGTEPASDIFDTSFWVNTTNASNNAEAGAYASMVASHFASSLGAGFSGIAGLNRGLVAHVYGYPTGGPVATAVGSAPITYSGTAGSGSNFNQICLVTTLLTAQSGRSKRGRMYWPAFNLQTQLPTVPLFAVTPVNTFVNGLANFFDAINADALAGTVTVVSRTLSSIEHVTAVRADYKPDTQRRRINKLSGGGAFTAVVTP
jgi:hypothetical protein